MSNAQQTLATIDQALEIVAKITGLIAEARASGKDTIDISPLAASFVALDMAESELDQAIREADTKG